MEFFKTIEVQTDAATLQKELVLEHLDRMNESFFLTGEVSGNKAPISGIWGDFTLQCDPVQGGVRFSLIECPNALTFTLTTGYPPAPKKIVMHLTVNRKRIKPVFLEEIDEFIEDWKSGLEKYFDT